MLTSAVYYCKQTKNYVNNKETHSEDEAYKREEEEGRDKRRVRLLERRI